MPGGGPGILENYETVVRHKDGTGGYSEEA
jgi:hypothetical protein